MLFRQVKLLANRACLLLPFVAANHCDYDVSDDRLLYPTAMSPLPVRKLSNFDAAMERSITSVASDPSHENRVAIGNAGGQVKFFASY